MDDSTRPAVLAALADELAGLWEAVIGAEGNLEVLEGLVRGGVLAIGARLLTAGLTARGTGKPGVPPVCGCGRARRFEGYRARQAQTLVGWVTVRRDYDRCVVCGRGQCPLDAALGLRRDSLSPGVRRLAARFGALLPFAEASASLAAAARVHRSASTMRTVTEAVGNRREQDLATEIAAAWSRGGAACRRGARPVGRGDGRDPDPGHGRHRARGQSRGGAAGGG